MAQAIANVAAPPLRLGLHLALLFLTLLTTTLAGIFVAYRPGLGDLELLRAGAGFAFTLLAILLAHEMGHYLFARVHHVDTSLPYVIPAPPILPGLGLVSFGTLGAVIRMRSPIATRDALVDIGASGPICGAIVALPLLIVGLSWSKLSSRVTPQIRASGSGTTRSTRCFGVSGPTAPAPAGHSISFGDNLLMRGVERLMFGPLPPGHDIQIHPVAMAAWFGLLVTSLNLFPIGQLDGGHVTFAALGPRAHRLLGRAVGYGLLLLAVFSSFSWLVWWLVATRFIGFNHPAITESQARLGPLRVALCLVSLALFALTFIPVPMDQF